MHSGKDFTGGKRGFARAKDELGQRQGSCALLRTQFDHGIQRQQRRHAISGRRGVAQVAADAARVLHLTGADLQCRLLQAAKCRRQIGGCNLGPSGGRTNAQTLIHRDAPQGRQGGDVQNRPVKLRACTGIEIGPPGQNAPWPFGQKRQRKIKVCGAGIGGHARSGIVCIQADCIQERSAVNAADRKVLARGRMGVYPEHMTQRPYVLDAQIGYVLRRVTQRHLALFSEAIPEVTTTQFAVLARLAELGPQSQNALGRETALDAATIKGVVDRLARQGLVSTFPDPDDRRRLTVDLSDEGRAVFLRLVPTALDVSARTLGPLSEAEQRQLLDLLMRLA